MPQYVIVIKENQFEPGSLRIEPGDSVVWDNQDPHDHTATSNSQKLRFSTGIIKPGTKSKAIVFPSATSYGGVEIICECEGSMEGRLFVTAGARSEAITPAGVPMATAATPNPGVTYSVDTWRAIARIVAAHGSSTGRGPARGLRSWPALDNRIQAGFG